MMSSIIATSFALQLTLVPAGERGTRTVAAINNEFGRWILKSQMSWAGSLLQRDTGGTPVSR